MLRYCSPCVGITCDSDLTLPACSHSVSSPGRVLLLRKRWRRFVLTAGLRLSITGFIFPGLISSQKVVNTGLHPPGSPAPSHRSTFTPTTTSHRGSNRSAAGHQNVGLQTGLERGRKEGRKIVDLVAHT